MKRLAILLTASVALAACGGGGDGRGGGGGGTAVVLVDGSSTVFPISEALGEEFQGQAGTRVTVGLSGTGGGFRKFCRNEIDVAGASRPIEQEEIELCRSNGVEFIELPVALDGLAVVVHPQNRFADCLTVEELRRVWQPEAQGRVTTWSQVRAGFPSTPLRLFGAGTDSGTFDYFTAAVNGREGASRGDYTATEDDNVTVTGVRGDQGSLGYLGLAYLQENQGAIRAVPVRSPSGQCVSPSPQTVRDGAYQPLSRPLFYYVNRRRAETLPHVQRFVAFAFDAARTAPIVSEVGYVPLPERVYALALAKFQARRTGTAFGDGPAVGVTLEQLVADAQGGATPAPSAAAAPTAGSTPAN